MRSRLGSALPAAAVLVSLALAGCTADGEPADPTTSPSVVPTPDGPAPEDVVETRSLVLDGAEVSAAVHPLVRADGFVVLTIDYLAAAAEDGDRVSVRGGFGGVATLGTRAVAGVRLLDLGEDVVHEPASDADLWVVQGDDAWESLTAGTPARMQLAYAAPPQTTDHMTLLLPGSYLVRDIPVIEGDVPAPVVPDDVQEDVGAIDLSAIEIAATYPLVSYTWQQEGVATLEEADRIQIDVDSDVLFATDSADLSPEAQGAIDLAAQQLETRGAGTVSVVGHTDSVSDDASNLDLSQRRAQAVATALGALLDTASYPIEAEGRGESEPIADNASEAGRQRNRRVEITLLAEREADSVIDASGDLPPAPELTATGAEGVHVDTNRPYTVRAPKAELVDGHLTVELLVTADDDEVDAAFGPGFMNSVWDLRPDALTPPNYMIYGIALLQGRTAMTSLDYAVPFGDHTAYICACELQSLNRVDGGQTRSMTLVYPAVGTPTTVTLENVGGLGAIPFRLTDIPVE